MMQIIGISFNLIIIRVSTNNTIESQHTMCTIGHGLQFAQRHGASGDSSLRFITGPDGSGSPSYTDYTSATVPSNESKKRMIELAHSDEESQKVPNSPEIWRAR
jgi:hypothetical protein